MKKRVPQKTPAAETFSLEEMCARAVALARSTGTVQKGSVANRVTWESGEYNYADTRQIKIVMEGLYTALDAIIPSRGTESFDYPNYVLDSASLTPRRGHLGKLVMTLVSKPGFAGIVSATVLRVKWEIDMARLEKPLLTHPKLTAGTMATHLSKWMEAEPTRKVLWQYVDASGVVSLTPDEIVWAQKILNGVDSYVVFAPVITKVSTHDGRPATGRCGIIQTPSVNVDGYEYLKTGDRSTQDDVKTWTRTEQWTGSDKIDTDIYEAG